jgi:segregation and condensation protein A
MTEVPPPSAPPEGSPPAEGGALPPGVAGYRVQLPTFEGPLDLLLHLIEEHELDVRDIPIAFVAQKYVEYILLMHELNIDVASEYLVMAATLAHIKSKMLLPTPPQDQEEDDEVETDPRAELVRRLLEYQKYKNAAEQLAAHDVLGRDVFPRGMPAPAVDGPAPIAGLNLFKLLDAFQGVLSRAKATIDHQIDFERFSITDRINELSDLLRSRPRLTFEELFDGQRSRADLIVTFLALLEMTRLRLTKLLQDGPLEMIFVELAVSEEAAANAAPSDAEEEELAPVASGLRAAHGSQELNGDPEAEAMDEAPPDDEPDDEFPSSERDDTVDSETER